MGCVRILYLHCDFSWIEAMDGFGFEFGRNQVEVRWCSRSDWDCHYLVSHLCPITQWPLSPNVLPMSF
jgi:hypothetical protein